LSQKRSIEKIPERESCKYASTCGLVASDTLGKRKGLAKIGGSKSQGAQGVCCTGFSGESLDEHPEVGKIFATESNHRDSRERNSASTMLIAPVQRQGGARVVRFAPTCVKSGDLVQRKNVAR